MRCHFQHQLCNIESFDIEKSNLFYQSPENLRYGFRKSIDSTWAINDMTNVNGNAIGGKTVLFHKTSGLFTILY